MSKNWSLLLGMGLMILIGVLSTLSSCTHDSSLIEGIDTVCFESQVMPIMQTSCGISGCHDGSAEGFNTTDYQTIMQAVTPNDPRGSKLYQVITDINSENMMPPDRPLTTNQRSIIEVWIAQGANHTTCSPNTNPGGGDTITINKDTICFNQNILPMFINNCAMTSCHDGSSQGEEDELYALNSYSTIRAHVNPFNPDASTVYRAVNGKGEEFMPPPPKPALTTVQKNLLKKWITDGALNSNCPNNNCDTTGTVGFTAKVKPIMDNYCISCHNASVSSGGVNLNGYLQVKSYAEKMRNGTPLLVGTIRQLSGFKAMPPSIKLDDCSIIKIESWIAQGKLDN
jgi:cytochrome c5